MLQSHASSMILSSLDLSESFALMYFVAWHYLPASCNVPRTVSTGNLWSNRCSSARALSTLGCCPQLIDNFVAHSSTAPGSEE